MKIGDLFFYPVEKNKKLMPQTVLSTIMSFSNQMRNECFVAEIDPSYKGGIDLCAHYHIDQSIGANCLIVECSRGDKRTIAACIVPVGFRYDMSGVVRKHLMMRRVSVAPLEMVLDLTQMEYGSISPIGLPKEWLIFVDPLVLQNERIIVGGGFVNSKLSIPSKLLLLLPNAFVLEGLAKLQTNE